MNLDLNDAVPVVWRPPGERESITFHVEPFDDIEALEASEAQYAIGKPDLEEGRRQAIEMTSLHVRWAVERVRRWENLEAGGKVAPCDADTKEAFFRRFRAARLLVLAALFGREDADRPKESGPGSDSGSRSPVSTVENDTPTDPTVNPTRAEVVTVADS